MYIMNFNIIVLLAVCYGAIAEEAGTVDDDMMKNKTTSTTSTTTIPPTTITIPTTTSPKTTVAPAVNYYYNVTDEATNVVCIMLDADISFKVTYNIGENNTNSSIVSIPKPSELVNVTGSCNDTDGTQFIDISWGESMPQTSVTLVFSQSKDGKLWSLKNLTSTIFFGTDFVNATEEGNSISSDIKFEMMPHEIPVNHSYKCFSAMNYGNFTTTIDDKPYAYPVVMSIDGIHLQAFNKIPQYNKFVDEVHCDADKIADIVPIAIGCALAILVVIVLIAYVIGRRRRNNSYHSV